MAETKAQIKTLSSDIDNPVQMNKNLLKSFQDALAKDPAADLLSLVGDTYVAVHRLAQYETLSEAGRFNLRTVNCLHDRVLTRSEINLREKFPSDYDRRYKSAMQRREEKIEDSPAKKQKIEPQDWLREKLEGIDTTSIIYPLSDQASALLQNDGSENGLSEGAVLKCNDELVLKVFPDSRDLTEYHNLEYLAEQASELPIPRLHGLIKLGKYRAMFMTYIPGLGLDNAWPALPTDAKQGLQKQLDGIFSRLRSLRQDDGLELGGVGAGGVKDYRTMEVFANRGITTAKNFDELQFSAKHCASPCHVKLLRSFLEEENKTIRGSVFTHGDLKKSNTTVPQDAKDGGAYVVTGIIDWEDSGFYPEYYECTTLSNGQSIMSDDDWYLNVPECISPQQHSVRWLVDRLWGNLLWSWRTDIVR
ncbi:hypothetical protein BJY04DRAFT_220179 [Aspergillus karnatakaensis]|uniref:uncharacterized protein n=1 Tax=Aspergillus karnatakaensis TaxID=1810916 RepID=UPI003CCD9E70